MEAKDLFGVVVRTLGLLIITSGLWYLAYAVSQAAGVSEETYPTRDYVVSGTLFTVLGVIQLLAAPVVVRVSYWKN